MSLRSLRKRLQRLEQQAFPADCCPRCRTPWGAIVRIRYIVPAGMDVPHDPPVEMCAECDRPLRIAICHVAAADVEQAE